MARAFEQVEISFGIILRRRRREMGFSQEKLAAAATLHRTYVSQIERGLKSPSLNALMLLSRALDIPPHELIKNMEDYLSDDNANGKGN